MALADLVFDAEGAILRGARPRAAVFWQRFRRHRLAVAGSAIVTALALTVFGGPLVVRHDPTHIESAHYGELRNLPPLSHAVDGLHLLGTDRSGRDYLARLMQGGRVSLALAAIVVVLQTTLGVVIGGVSGYYGRWVDSLIMRVVDFMLTLPMLPLLLVLYTLVPADAVPGGSVTVVAVVLILFGWPGPSRLMRGMVLTLKHQAFTEAARSLGASDRHIILRHMLPNAIAPVLVSATLSVGGVVVTEAALSYLGFGVRPPSASWGNMLNDVQGKMLMYPFQVFYPGMAIFLVSLSFNFIGDALRDTLDPRAGA